MAELSRAQLIVVLSCVESEVQRVEAFVADHGGPGNNLNSPHVWWLGVARDAQAKLVKQQEALG